MDPAGLDGGGGGSSHGGEDRPHPRWPFRTFTRGGRHSGPSCHSAQDRKASQVCRYFQRGFCFHGDGCSYQHPQPPGHLQWGRRHSEPPVTRPGPPLGLTRRGSEPTYLPSAAVGWGGAGAVWDSEGLAGRNEALGGSSWKLLLTSSDGDHSYSQKSRPQSDPVQELWAPLQSMGLEREQDSRNVVCGICMDKVWDKPEGKRIFGILPNCTHAHCLGCLRTWRKSHQHFPLNVIKACPQCRVYSSYMIPHKFWVGEGAEKEKLIRNFKARTRKKLVILKGTTSCPHTLPVSDLPLSKSEISEVGNFLTHFINQQLPDRKTTPRDRTMFRLGYGDTRQIRCRYFARGSDCCPFKSDCIYLHQLPDTAPSSAPPGPDCTQPASGREMVPGPAVLLGDGMFLDYNLAAAAAFLGLELLLDRTSS